MAITATAYPTLALQMALGAVNISTATGKVTLHTSTYTPDKDHAFFSDVTDEVTGTGYTAGGEPLTSLAVTYDDTTDATVIDCDDPGWAALTTTYRYAVWWLDTGDPTTSVLLCWTDFGADQSPAGTALSLDVDSSGLVRIA